MECKIKGEPTPTIAWFKDSKELIENKKYSFDYSELVASIKIKDATEKDTSSITCEASNDLGSVKTTGQLEVQGQCCYGDCLVAMVIVWLPWKLLSLDGCRANSYHFINIIETICSLYNLENKYCLFQP